jgi:hypothetical protein
MSQINGLVFCVCSTHRAAECRRRFVDTTRLWYAPVPAISHNIRGGLSHDKDTKQMQKLYIKTLIQGGACTKLQITHFW